MATLYWIGNVSSNVNTAANWSVYPVGGVTLPPGANSGPTAGDTLIFSWSGVSSGCPIYPPVGTISQHIDYVLVKSNFELDIGSIATPLGLSANKIDIGKVYQSNPNYADNYPSVHILSSGSGTLFNNATDFLANIPAAFNGAAASQCCMAIDGDYKQVKLGYVQGSSTAMRNNTIYLGYSASTNIGYTSLADQPIDHYVLDVSRENANGKIIIGSECTFITPSWVVPGGYEYEWVELNGNGVEYQIKRGADFSSGGILITASPTTVNSTPNILHFMPESYPGASGYDAGTRTTVNKLYIDGINEDPGPTLIPIKDPVVWVEHGVDFTGKVTMNGGSFTVFQNQEVTRTYGNASQIDYYLGPNPTKLRLASNCSFRKIKLISPPNAFMQYFSWDINFEGRPLKTLFMNQHLIEGVTSGY